MQLPCKRFVKQVSNGGSFSKYGYIDLMQRNAKALETAPWREAQCALSDVSLTVGQLTRTDGTTDEAGRWATTPSYTAWLDDRYDVFVQGGDAVSQMATLCGYAGCVAYRFSLPAANQSAMTSLSIAVQRDRYLRAGVRIALIPSNDATPDNYAWWSIRDSGKRTDSETAEASVTGVSSWGFLGQKDVPFLLAGRATGGSWEFGSEQSPAFGQSVMATFKYLWVFVTLEDPAAYWDLYSATEQRYYYIEGSAMLVPSMCEFTFESGDTQPPDETGWRSGVVLDHTMRKAFPAALPHGLQDMSALFGDLYSVSNQSAVFHPYSGNRDATCFGALLNAMEQSPGSMMFSGDVYGSSMYGRPGVAVELRDYHTLASLKGDGGCGLFALARNHYTGDSQFTVTPSGLDDDVVGNATAMLSGSTALYLGYQPIVVPVGAAHYTQLRLTSLFPGGSSGYGVLRIGFSIAINFWRVTSPDATGPLDWLALAALAKNPAFFTGSEGSISGTVQTAGDAIVSVSARAQLVAVVDADDFGVWNGRTTLLANIGTARPGELIVITPNIRRIYADVDPTGGNASFPGFTPSGTFCFFGERTASISEAGILAAVVGNDENGLGLKLRAEFA